VNYRSVWRLGKLLSSTRPEEKLERHCVRFTEKINFRRPLNDARQPMKKELKATSILRLPLTEVFRQIEAGPVEDDARRLRAAGLGRNYSRFSLTHQCADP